MVQAMGPKPMAKDLEAAVRPAVFVALLDFRIGQVHLKDHKSSGNMWELLTTLL